METQKIQTRLFTLQMSGIAVVVLSLGIGIAAAPAPTFALESPAVESKPGLQSGCRQCAVVTSIQEIEALEHEIHATAENNTATAAGNALTGKSARRYVVTVRMRDGSTRVIEQARQANWQINERLILIGADDGGNES